MTESKASLIALIKQARAYLADPVDIDVAMQLCDIAREMYEAVLIKSQRKMQESLDEMVDAAEMHLIWNNEKSEKPLREAIAKAKEALR